jgi:hypothetical protein
MVVGIAGEGLPAPNNDAAVLCRVSTAHDCSPVSVAAGPIHDLPHLLGSSVADWRSRRLGQPVTPVFSTVPCFVPRTPTHTASSAVRCRRAEPRRKTPVYLACDVIVSGLVFARQGRARTLGDGLLGERLLRDRDGVGGDHGVFVIVECEHRGRNSHADGIAFTAITVHYDTHASSFTLP